MRQGGEPACGSAAVAVARSGDEGGGGYTLTTTVTLQKRQSPAP